jgi:hypothetical protein
MKDPSSTGPAFGPLTGPLVARAFTIVNVWSSQSKSLESREARIGPNHLPRGNLSPLPLMVATHTCPVDRHARQGPKGIDPLVIDSAVGEEMYPK